MNIFKLKERNEKELLIKCFNFLDNSELLKHEVTYALGQMEYDEITGEFLREVL